MTRAVLTLFIARYKTLWVEYYTLKMIHGDEKDGRSFDPDLVKAEFVKQVNHIFRPVEESLRFGQPVEDALQDALQKS
jgi:hypothetical protein